MRRSLSLLLLSALVVMSSGQDTKEDPKASLALKCEMCRTLLGAFS